MATVLEECTTKEQRSVVRFLRAKGLNAKININKYFLFTVGSFCRVKQFAFGSKSFDDDDDEECKTEVRKWLRQQSKDFHVVIYLLTVLRIRYLRASGRVTARP
jgi:hypothetical protein